jgi:AcrR family transcriptional regulator
MRYLKTFITDDFRVADMTSVIDQTVAQRLAQSLASLVWPMSTDEILALTIEQLADSIGISRATAYRHIGSRDELRKRAMLAIAAEWSERLIRELPPSLTAVQRIEEAWVLSERHNREDNRLEELSVFSQGSDAHQMRADLATSTFTDALVSAQKDHQLRSDITIDELHNWLLTQHQICQAINHDEHTTRRWFRKFVAPAIVPQGDPNEWLAARMQVLLEDVRLQVEQLDSSISTEREALTKETGSVN